MLRLGATSITGLNLVVRGLPFTPDPGPRNVYVITREARRDIHNWYHKAWRDKARRNGYNWYQTADTKKPAEAGWG